VPDYRDDLEPSAVYRHAGEWGLASLIMGGVLALMAPMTLVFNLILWLNFDRAIEPSLRTLARQGGMAAVAGIGLLCLLSVGFGIKGWRSAVATGQPAGLGVAGTLVSLMATLAWVIVGGDLLMILGTFVK
jgi:hypothetical protein